MGEHPGEGFEALMAQGVGGWGEVAEERLGDGVLQGSAVTDGGDVVLGEADTTEQPGIATAQDEALETGRGADRSARRVPAPVGRNRPVDRPGGRSGS